MTGDIEALPALGVCHQRFWTSKSMLPCSQTTARRFEYVEYGYDLKSIRSTCLHSFRSSVAKNCIFFSWLVTQIWLRVGTANACVIECRSVSESAALLWATESGTFCSYTHCLLLQFQTLKAPEKTCQSISGIWHPSCDILLLVKGDPERKTTEWGNSDQQFKS